MRYGVHLGGGAALRTADAVKQIGELAEELGYDGILTGDHITIPKSIASEYPYTKFSRSLGADPYAVFTTIDWLDAFTILALLIPVTKNVRLGTSVTIVPYRHPLEMARVVATVDVVSGGRVIFGAGVGWMEEEFRLPGVPIQYLESARLGWWLQLTQREGLAALDMILARTEIDYRSPAYFGEAVRVGVRCAWLRRSSFGLELRIEERGSGRRLADAKKVCVYYDFDARRSLPVPPQIRAQLKAQDPELVEEAP